MMNILKYTKNKSNLLKPFRSKLKKCLSDKIFIKLKYKREFNKKINLKNPKTFNEKLQWLKLYDRKPLYTKLVDKHEVKEYVSNIIGAEYIIPTIGIYEKFDDINFDELPNKFVIKCTHDSGGIVICNDKETLDIKQAKNKINKSLNENYYYGEREWPYKNVKPQIIIEELIEDKKLKELRDYKFYCFNGSVDCVMVCSERSSGNTKYYFFDKNWKLKKYNLSSLGLDDDFTLEKPDRFDDMINIAKRLNKQLPFVRIDLYEVNGKIYFGEYTFYPFAGFDNKLTTDADIRWGDMLKLPNKKD